MSIASDRAAAEFVRNETPFHLGFLPTEQSHPDSRTLEHDFKRSAADGVRCMQNIDVNVLKMAQKVLKSDLFVNFADTLFNTIVSGHRVVFSGCGATGRLSILLDSMWRRFCFENSDMQQYINSVGSIMTGGDYALVRSVEFFEDYAEFGREQVRQMALQKGDTLVAITEGGETSSVLGTLDEAVKRDLNCFLLFNNPSDLLCQRLERSRQAIENEKVTVLDLYCGPMALAGSTRLQATSSEQLIAGAALEMAACRLKNLPLKDYAEDFQQLLDVLGNAANVKNIADYIEFEEGIYRHNGKMTYFADRFLLDIFTDTTERCPTFMTPPFCRKDTPELPQSWAFVKHPDLPARETWEYLLHRPLQCLDWQYDDYVRMNAAENILNRLPQIAEKDLLMFEIGCENAPLRQGCNDAAVALMVGGEQAIALPEGYKNRKTLVFGSDGSGDFAVMLPDMTGPLQLMMHMALKLVLNIISTGIMVRLGRVSGNWMSWVDLSNKKLIDRGIRLVSELGKIDYENAAKLIFACREAWQNDSALVQKYGSVVQYALDKIRSESNTAGY